MDKVRAIPWRQVATVYTCGETYMSEIKLSQKSMTALFRGKFEPRVRMEGEAPPVTFSHIKDGQTYKTDWATPVRPGAMDHLTIQSRGEHD
jgi:hypothetical protein